MKGVSFKIVISEKGSIDEDGKDDIEFLLSANPRSALEVRAGGELSRVMLGHANV